VRILVYPKYCDNLKGTGMLNRDEIHVITSLIMIPRVDQIIGEVDCDDKDYQVKEEDNNIVKRGAEAILKRVCNDVNGTFGLLLELVDELTMWRIIKI
jgi:hypothetical protein